MIFFIQCKINLNTPSKVYFKFMYKSYKKVWFNVRPLGDTPFLIATATADKMLLTYTYTDEEIIYRPSI